MANNKDSVNYFTIDKHYLREQARTGVRNYFAPLRWLAKLFR